MMRCYAGCMIGDAMLDVWQALFESMIDEWLGMFDVMLIVRCMLVCVCVCVRVCVCVCELDTTLNMPLIGLRHKTQ